MNPRLLIGLILTAALRAPDPAATIEGTIVDPTAKPVSQARVIVRDLRQGTQRVTVSNSEGAFHLPLLPVGEYGVAVEVAGFARFEQQPIALSVSQVATLTVTLALERGQQQITVTGEASGVETASNAVGKTVTTREILDLPLNGRNFTQLGLLQAGVAPLTNGVATGGGSLRAGQAYAVNGQRPESNNFLLDGVRNINPMAQGRL